jgi:hypothetical protein
MITRPGDPGRRKSRRPTRRAAVAPGPSAWTGNGHCRRSSHGRRGRRLRHHRYRWRSPRQRPDGAAVLGHRAAGDAGGAYSGRDSERGQSRPEQPAGGACAAAAARRSRLVRPRRAPPRVPPAQATVPTGPEEPALSAALAADVVLIGCVRTKHAAACPAAELFASPLFEGRRRYADGRGRPWYILSAKFGLLAPGDVIGPYDVYLADQSPAYRRAWGEFVTAQLKQKRPDLQGRTVEVHAGAAYADPLRGPAGCRRCHAGDSASSSGAGRATRLLQLPPPSG